MVNSVRIFSKLRYSQTLLWGVAYSFSFTLRATLPRAECECIGHIRRTEDISVNSSTH